MKIKTDKEIYANYDVDSILTMMNRVDTLHFFTSNTPNDINEHISNIPHILTSLTIGLCIGGNAKMKLNSTEQEMVSQQLIFLLPNTIVKPLSISKDFRIHSIIFDFDFIASSPLLHSLYMDSKIRNHPILELDNKDFTLIENLFSLINGYYYRSEKENAEEVISHLLSALLSELNRLFLLENSVLKITRAKTITNSFLTLLQNSYTREREVSFYASKLNISPKYLTTVVRQETGKSISAWISEFVITHIKFLLKATDKSITSISEELNFVESTLLSRYFKKSTGKTPSQFRKGMK